MKETFFNERKSGFFIGGQRLKSNVVCVKPPLTILRDVVSKDPFMPYLIIVSESPSSSDGLEGELN